jgi:hypothetical protein
MFTKNPNDLELYKRTDEVLFYIWDPISVSDTPAARDEYERYLPVVFSMLKQSKPIDEIADYLSKIEIESMGLGDASGLKNKNIKVAELLNDHKEWIEEKFHKV